jgi:hypothetical protein
MKCPYCESESVFRSVSGNARLPWFVRLFAVSVRCYECERRFLLQNLLRLGGPVAQSPSLKRIPADLDSTAEPLRPIHGARDAAGAEGVFQTELEPLCPERAGRPGKSWVLRAGR